MGPENIGFQFLSRSINLTLKTILKYNSADAALRLLHSHHSHHLYGAYRCKYKVPDALWEPLSQIDSGVQFLHHYVIEISN